MKTVHSFVEGANSKKKLAYVTAKFQNPTRKNLLKWISAKIVKNFGEKSFGKNPGRKGLFPLFKNWRT